MDMKKIENSDSKIADAIKKEINRQKNTLALIASENFASEAVLEVTGTVLTNKYSEGYPSRRYYGGNQFIDVCESLAIERAKKLFGAEHANVQPHSGSSANMAAYFALTEWGKKGKKILGMTLAHGGHLTHGSPVNFSGKLFDIISYGVDKETHILDYDAIRKIAIREKPTIIVSGATVYPRKIDFKAFEEIASEADAFHVADIAHIAGLVAAGEHQNPVPHSDIVTTTTHKTLRGPRGAIILCKKEHAEAVDRTVFPGTQGGPLEHIIAAKAVCFEEAMQPEFRDYQKQVVMNAKVLAEELISNGFILLTEGTDNHLMLLDLTNIGLTGKEAERILNNIGIIVNRNMIPFDKRKPMDPSGIRIGTPAITTRGMKESEMKSIAEIITKILKNPRDKTTETELKKQVLQLCRDFPLYPGLDD